ncbi:uncharacterized protein [Diadema setosum]|uniref:uncharacterized protein n=1 Tax=Diadema setosum TaxID=31175 RepID=UPI003B3A25CA
MNAKYYTKFCLRGSVLCMIMWLAGGSGHEPNEEDPTPGERTETRLHLKEGAPMGDYESGQKHMMAIERDSQHPHYGTCWTNALQVVATGCRRLTDDEQSRMALTLANCHLAKAGIDPYPCEASMSTTECLLPWKESTIAFNAYTEFFTHTQDICFFLQSQVWHQHTEETVEKLAQSSEDVAERLEETGRLQASMIQQQNESLRNQKEILAQEAQLKLALQTSSSSIKEVFEEMKTSTLEQKALFAETFDRLAQVQKLMLGEFTWFNSAIYYILILVLAYVLTSTPRTAGARFGLYLLLILNWVTEWLLSHLLPSDDQTEIHTRTWLCRKVFCGVSAFYWLYCASRYRDYNEINHRLLLDIQKHVHRGAIQAATRPVPSLQNALKEQLTGNGGFLPSLTSSSSIKAIQHKEATLSRTEIQVTDLSSDSSDMEVTYNPVNVASTSVIDSTTSRSHYQTSEPANRNASISNETATPIRVPSESNPDATMSSKRKRGRPKGSKNRTSREGTPVNSPGFKSPYNLRTRRAHQSPNPILDLETTLMFAQQVESMVSRHYVIERAQPSPTSSSHGRRSGSGVGRSRSPGDIGGSPSFFSSDDEP